MQHAHAAAIASSSRLASTANVKTSQASQQQIERHREELGRTLLFVRPGSSPSDSLTFRLLLASNIHKDYKNILKIAQQLGEMHVRGERPVHAVLIPGNLANMNMDDFSNKERNSIANVANGEGEAMTVLSRFEQIKRRVFYIPGQSDPISLYARSRLHQEDRKTAAVAQNKPPNLTLKSVNVHDWWLEIEEGIVIAGFGGAGNDFPYETEQQVVDGCGRVLSSSIAWWREQQRRRQCEEDGDHKSETKQMGVELGGAAGGGAAGGGAAGGGAAAGGGGAGGAQDYPQIILMTHLGSKLAAVSEGASASGSPYPIAVGAEGLRAVLASPEAQASLLLNVQGQVGVKFGQEHVGSVPVVSAGSLNDSGQYSVIEFSRPAVGERWVIEDVSLRNVNAC